MSDRDAVTMQAMYLREYAEHFVQRDWNYTRDLGGLAAIRYDDHFDQPWERVKRSARMLFGRTPQWAKGWSPSRFRMAWHVLRRDPRTPDGVLDGGAIITYWEEAGEYLQLVQPSVGSLLADWMEAEPDSPHAGRIAREMRRIQDSYAERLRREGA